VGKTTNHPVVLGLLDRGPTLKSVAINLLYDIDRAKVFVDKSMTAERIRQLTDDYRNELNLMNAKNRQISKEEDEIATLKSELARKNTQLAEEQRDKKRLERRVDALESEKLNAEKDASRWKKKYSNNEEKLNSYAQEKRDFEDTIDALQEEVASLKRERPVPRERNICTQPTQCCQSPAMPYSNLNFPNSNYPPTTLPHPSYPAQYSNPSFQSSYPNALYPNAQLPMNASFPQYQSGPPMGMPTPPHAIDPVKKEEEELCEPATKSRRVSQSAPKFCSICGWQKTSAKSNYCSSCGAKL
jgi:hypothetical protein